VLYNNTISVFIVNYISLATVIIAASTIVNGIVITLTVKTKTTEPNSKRSRHEQHAPTHIKRIKSTKNGFSSRTNALVRGGTRSKTE